MVLPQSDWGQLIFPGVGLGGPMVAMVTVALARLRDVAQAHLAALPSRRLWVRRGSSALPISPLANGLLRVPVTCSLGTCDAVFARPRRLQPRR